MADMASLMRVIGRDRLYCTGYSRHPATVAGAADQRSPRRARDADPRESRVPSPDGRGRGGGGGGAAAGAGRRRRPASASRERARPRERERVRPHDDHMHGDGIGKRASQYNNRVFRSGGKNLTHRDPTWRVWRAARATARAPRGGRCTAFIPALSRGLTALATPRPGARLAAQRTRVGSHVDLSHPIRLLTAQASSRPSLTSRAMACRSPAPPFARTTRSTRGGSDVCARSPPRRPTCTTCRAARRPVC